MKSIIKIAPKEVILRRNLTTYNWHVIDLNAGMENGLDRTVATRIVHSKKYGLSYRVRFEYDNGFHETWIVPQSYFVECMFKNDEDS